MPRISPTLSFLCCGLALGLASGCAQWRPDVDSPTNDAAALSADVTDARLILSASVDWRQRALRFMDTRQIRDADPISSSDLQSLYRGAEDCIFLVRRWQALEEAQGVNSSAVGRSTATRPGARLRVKLALLAGLAQHDDYTVGVLPYERNIKLRNLLRHDSPSIAGELHHANLRHVDPARNGRMRALCAWQETHGEKATGTDPNERWLDACIAASPAYEYFRQNLARHTVAFSSTGSMLLANCTADSVRYLCGKTSFQLSKLSGNTMGMVEMRKGLMTSLSDNEVHTLAATLRPGDILLEKTPFRLTDKFIPGYYGHVAIWIGTPDELRAMGIWANPLVQAHAKDIESGSRIAEALRPGVRLTPLSRFLNIDDLLVLRPRSISDGQRRDAVLRALAQVGKEYDFEFDVETDKRIVCSEIAYVVYPDIAWPTSKILGRHSISPDQVASRALGNGPFIPVRIYQDGRRLEAPLESKLQRLIAPE